MGNGKWALTEEGQTIENEEHSTVAPSPDPEKLQVPLEKDSWRKSLSRVLLELTPKAFERLCQIMMSKSGFERVNLTGGPGDDGIDGHGIIRLAGLISIPVLFQCKRYKGKVTSKEVREFRGALHGKSDYGLFLTTGEFTKNACQEATKEGASPIDLIDGEILMDKLKELELGVKTRADGVVELDTRWFDSL